MRPVQRPRLPPLKTILLSNQDYKCIYCRKELTYNETVIDHFEPFLYVKHRTKFFACCIRCNQVKGCKVFETIGEAREYIMCRMQEKISTEKKAPKVLQPRVPMEKLGPKPSKKENRIKIEKLNKVKIKSYKEMPWAEQSFLLYFPPHRFKTYGTQNKNAK